MKVLIIPDLHIPYQDDKSLKVVEKFMSDNVWDEIVYLGDILDLDMISSFNITNLRENETRRLVEDLAIANAMLDRHQKIIRSKNKKAKITILEGNHENRMERLINAAPHLEGLLELPGNLHLPERGAKWVKNWTEGELYNIGKLYFSHGLYLNRYHASKMVDVFGVNIIYGHTHDVMSFTKTTLGKDKVHMSQSLGHLADEHKLKYMKKGPNNWCQAIGVAEIRPTGDFNLYPITIINHSFTFNGKVYK